MAKSLDFTVAEYFAGIGLVHLGVKQAGWKVIFSNDFSEKKYEMFKDFFPNEATSYVVGDIFDLDPDAIPSTTMATCSFPCVDLSLAGKMRGINGSHSSAFWGFFDIIRSQGSKAPPIVLLENVTGWLSSNDGNDFRVTVEAINDLGYVCDVITVNALNFTPQSRPRIFLIGYRKAKSGFSDINKIVGRPNSLMSNRLRKSVQDNSDLKWFYLPIPSLPPLLREGLGKDVIEEIDRNSSLWWDHNKVEKHVAMMTVAHRERVIALAGKDRISYRTFYRRTRDGKQRVEVRAGDTAGCLRTALGGSAKQFVIKLGRGAIEMRNMTPREYARLQGVPDSFPIKVPETQALTGFGDAVCVPAITWIAENAVSILVDDLKERKAEGVAVNQPDVQIELEEIPN